MIYQLNNVPHIKRGTFGPLLVLGERAKRDAAKRRERLTLIERRRLSTMTGEHFRKLRILRCDRIGDLRTGMSNTVSFRQNRETSS